jgi:hypothetical protein
MSIQIEDWSGVTVQDYEGGPRRQITTSEAHDWIHEVFYGIILNPKYQLDPSKQYEYPAFFVIEDFSFLIFFLAQFLELFIWHDRDHIGHLPFNFAVIQPAGLLDQPLFQPR